MEHTHIAIPLRPYALALSHRLPPLSLLLSSSLCAMFGGEKCVRVSRVCVCALRMCASERKRR